MDTNASIIKATLSDQKLLRESAALDRVRTTDRNADLTARDSASAILHEAPRVCRIFGRRLGSVIVIVALLVRRRGRGSLLLGVPIGTLGALKYLGHF
jgi:hypothetical protein